MTPRHHFRMNYPEEARKIDQGFADAGIIVVNAFTKGLRFIFPFFVPRPKETNKTDKHNAEGIK